MAQGLTDSPKYNRFKVISVDTAASTLRVRGASETCADFMCGEALVITDEGATRDLERLHPGDIVTLDHKDGRAQQIRVVRRALDEYSGPEW